jgi:amino acid permease
MSSVVIASDSEKDLLKQYDEKPEHDLPSPSEVPLKRQLKNRHIAMIRWSVHPGVHATVV